MERSGREHDRTFRDLGIVLGTVVDQVSWRVRTRNRIGIRMQHSGFPVLSSLKKVLKNDKKNTCSLTLYADFVRHLWD